MTLAEVLSSFGTAVVSGVLLGLTLVAVSLLYGKR